MWKIIVYIITFFISFNAYSSADDKNKSLFAPSYLGVKDHRKLTPDDWTNPEICGQCHVRQYQGWKTSMHSNAFKDPIFQALWAIGEKATKGGVKNHCSGCHTPIGTLTDSIKFNPNDGLHGSFSAPPIAEKGVSCDVCHTISSDNFSRTAVLEHGNSSFIVDPGPIKRATLKNSSSPFHATQYSDLHESSKFCGNCHNIFHPTNDFPIERTYDEWKYSIYAQNDIQCMDCHMVPVEVAIKVADTLTRPHKLKDIDLSGIAAIGGPVRNLIHDHGFVGGNAAIASVLAGKKSSTYNESVKRLQNVASLGLTIKPKSRFLNELTVRVNNDRAGHHLPTSLTEVRQMWLEVVVTDDKDRELLRAGTLDKKTNKLPKDAVIFNAHAVDKNGKHTEFPWDIARFTTVNTIPAKGYKDANYAFNIYPDSHKVTVVARLHYRSFSQGLSDLLLGKGKVIVPSIEMVIMKKEYIVQNQQIIINNDHKDDNH